MTRAQEAAAILARARMYKFVREAKGNHNTGRWVEAFQTIGGTVRGQPWCVCYVTTVVGIWFDGKPPFGYLASCDDLLQWATVNSKLVAVPEPGDLFLVLKTPTDATHVGFVAAVGGGRMGTIEGNASNPDEPPTGEGYGVFERPVTHARARALTGKLAFVRYL